MKVRQSRKLFTMILAALFIVVFSAATVMGSDKALESSAPKVQTTRDHKVPEFFVTPPPFSEGIFPCSQCHADMEPNKQRRELYFHTEITEIFDHASEQRWCLDCHNSDDRDQLRLVNEDLISFEESYYLCGQCHGTIFRDWKAGIHGKRTGQWNGKKQYRLCVQCHNPHSPRFKPLKPLPPPIAPDKVRYKRLEPNEIPLNPLGDMK